MPRASSANCSTQLSRGGLLQPPPEDRSRQFDVAIDLEFEVDPAERHDSLRRQSFAALQPALRNGIAHSVLDLALRGDAELLEELAYAGIENLLVHDRSPRPHRTACRRDGLSALIQLPGSNQLKPRRRQNAKG